MTPLEHIIRDEIERDGPMRLDRYMSLCLSHPAHGYYTTRNPFGQTGDFITSPDISQMFGELIGLWLAQCWQDQGSPSDIALVELGPGRGTLMADARRSMAMVPGLNDVATMHLVETSPVLRKACEATMPDTQISWHSDLSTVPDRPFFLVANEFLDALPVRQFQKVDTIWFERFVNQNDDGLGITLRPLSGAKPDGLADAMPDGKIVEINALATALAADIGKRLEQSGGAALFIDYGDWDAGGDTLQAVQSHKTVSAFHEPGQSDLTTHVVFDVLSAASGVTSHFSTQGAFLERLGITARANQLAAQVGREEANKLVADHRRLTHPEEMGTLFKALALTPNDAPKPVGFE